MSPAGCLGSLALSTKDLNKSKAEGGKKASSSLLCRAVGNRRGRGQGAGGKGPRGRLQAVRGLIFWKE